MVRDEACFAKMQLGKLEIQRLIACTLLYRGAASVDIKIIFRSACAPQRQESVPRNNKALLSMGPLNENGWNIVHGAPDAVCALPEQATSKLLHCALC